MNKHELVSEREYEDCLDHVYTLNEDTPVLKTYERKDVAVDPDLVFGLDTKLFQELQNGHMIDGYVDDHHSREIDILLLEGRSGEGITRETLDTLLSTCSNDQVYRIKGFIKIVGEGMCILNYAFGRWDLTPITKDIGNEDLRLTAMLAKGEGRQWQKEFSKELEVHKIQAHFHQD